MTANEEGRGWYSTVGIVIGGLAGAIAYISVCIAAVRSVGWVVGIALGWIPAGLAAALAFFLGRYLWLPLVIGMAFLIRSIFDS